MSYVSSSSGGTEELVQTAVHAVPGWTSAQMHYAMGHTLKAGLFAAVGVVFVIVFLMGLKSALAWLTAPKSGFQDRGMAWRGMGAAGTDTIKPSDPIFGYPKGANKKDTFLNHGVGPEFVEQPNYLLGQEDMQRHALSQWNRLKLSGAPVSDWPTYWAAYKAENSDDLSASMYDFGSDGFKGSAKELRGAGLGR